MAPSAPCWIRRKCPPPLRASTSSWRALSRTSATRTALVPSAASTLWRVVRKPLPPLRRVRALPDRRLRRRLWNPLWAAGVVNSLSSLRLPSTWGPPSQSLRAPLCRRPPRATEACTTEAQQPPHPTPMCSRWAAERQPLNRGLMTPRAGHEVNARCPAPRPACAALTARVCRCRRSQNTALPGAAA